MPPTMAEAPLSPPMPPPSAAVEGGEDSNLPKPDARRASLLDSIKGAGLSKLRKRDDAAEAERRPARKEPPKAMSMQDALRERLARRNDAISGKSDRDSKQRDSIIIREAAGRASTSAPPLAKKPNSVAPVVFAKVGDPNKNDPDNESTMLPSMPARLPPRSNHHSDSDSDSDMSLDSRVTPVKKPAAIIAPPVLAAPIQPAPVRPTASLPAAPAERNDQAVFASLLARASTVGKKKSDDDSDSDGDDGEDWD
jgi:hypothetical protein